MRGPTSGFLDRVHQDALIEDRTRLAGEVRATFYALLACMDREDAEAWTRLLPPELESLWKPPYFEIIRSREDAGDGPGTSARAARPVELLRRRLPEERRGEAEQLVKAVLSALGEQVDPERREAVKEKLPRELSRLLTPTAG